jgi:hypothetical protein
VKDENGDLLADTQNIINRWKNYFSRLLKVHNFRDVRQIGVLRPVWGCRQSQQFLFPYSPFYITTCFGLYRPSSSEIYTVVFGSYYAYNGSVFRQYSHIYIYIYIYIYDYKRPKLWNMDVRFGTWNVRSLMMQFRAV